MILLRLGVLLCFFGFLSGRAFARGEVSIYVPSPIPRILSIPLLLSFPSVLSFYYKMGKH